MSFSGGLDVRPASCDVSRESLGFLGTLFKGLALSSIFRHLWNIIHNGITLFSFYKALNVILHNICKLDLIFIGWWFLAVWCFLIELILYIQICIFFLLHSFSLSPSPSFVSGLTKYAVPKELFVMDVSGEITFFSCIISDFTSVRKINITTPR